MPNMSKQQLDVLPFSPLRPKIVYSLGPNLCQKFALMTEAEQDYAPWKVSMPYCRVQNVVVAGRVEDPALQLKSCSEAPFSGALADV